MGEDIRIFPIEIIHFIGCNITTVIVIIFTESPLSCSISLSRKSGRIWILTSLQNTVINSFVCDISGVIQL